MTNYIHDYTDDRIVRIGQYKKNEAGEVYDFLHDKVFDTDDPVRLMWVSPTTNETWKSGVIRNNDLTWLNAFIWANQALIATEETRRVYLWGAEYYRTSPRGTKEYMFDLREYHES